MSKLALLGELRERGQRGAFGVDFEVATQTNAGVATADAVASEHVVFARHPRFDLLRDECKLTGTSGRLPRSGTLVDAMSRAVNTGRPLREVLDLSYPWCVPHADAITELPPIREQRTQRMFGVTQCLRVRRAMATADA